MFDIVKMFFQGEAPVGLSSLGLYKTLKSPMARKLRNISGLSPIFNYEYKDFNLSKSLLPVQEGITL